MEDYEDDYDEEVEEGEEGEEEEEEEEEEEYYDEDEGRDTGTPKSKSVAMQTESGSGSVADLRVTPRGFVTPGRRSSREEGHEGEAAGEAGEDAEGTGAKEVCHDYPMESLEV